MKKDEFFEWIKRFSETEKEKLSKASNTLPTKSQTFVRNVIKRITDWEEKKSTVSFSLLIKKIKKNEGRAFTKGDISRAISRLKDFLYDFIIKNEIEKSELLKYKIIFNSAKKRNFTEAYFYYLDNREKENNNQNTRSFAYYQEAFEQNYYRYFHAEFEKHKSQTTKNYQDFKPENVLHQSWENLQQAFLIMQFRVACEIVYNKSAIQADENILNTIDLSRLNQQLETTLSSDSIVLQIYSNLYKWLINNNLNDIDGLKLIITQSLDNIKIFPNEEQVSLLILLINCFGKMYKVSTDITSIFKCIEKLAVFGFEQGIFGQEASVDENLFMGLYDVLYQINPTFCQDLKEKYIDFLSTKEDKKWVLTFIKIRELAEEKKYYEILQLLNKLQNHKNYRFAIRRFVCLLQYTYELKLEIINKKISNFSFEEEEIVSQANFENLVNNIKYNIENADYLQKPSKTEISSLTEFINIVVMLYYQNVPISEIEARIENHAVFAKSWLLKKVVEIKKRLDN